MAEPTAPQTDAGSPINQTLMDGVRENLGNVPIGTIIQRYDYNGALAAPAKYMLCNGDVINETNYDAGHSTDWDDDIGTTALDGLYLPDLTGDKFLKGGSATTQDGTGALTFAGNASNQIDIEHNHDHNHAWINYQENYAGARDRSTTYDSGGSLVAFTAETTDETDSADHNLIITIGAEGADVKTLPAKHYTDKDATNSESATQSIEPHNLIIEYWMKIV